MSTDLMKNRKIDLKSMGTKFPKLIFALHRAGMLKFLWLSVITLGFGPVLWVKWCVLNVTHHKNIDVSIWLYAVSLPLYFGGVFLPPEWGELVIAIAQALGTLGGSILAAVCYYNTQSVWSCLFTVYHVKWRWLRGQMGKHTPIDSCD